MSRLQIDYVAPETLNKNPWNPNKVDPINHQKLVNSLKEVDVFKPILVRTLDDGSLEIIGGQHRVEALITLGHTEVPILNLGVISERRAKEITLLDNSQYGDLDHYKFAELVGDGQLGDMSELLSKLPMDEDELSNLFDHSLDEIENLEMEFDDDDSDTIDLEPPANSNARTHQIMRFKIPSEDAHLVTELINRIKAEQGFTESDDLTNAGDALIHFVKEAQ